MARTVYFSAGHRYEMAGRSAEENRRAYGELFREGGGFGHNFKIEAHFEGEIDPLTGMIENLVVIDDWLKAVTSQLDHRFLNQDLEFFRQNPATAENIARFCLVELDARMTNASVRLVKVRLVKVRLYEGDSTWIDVSK
ncbi:MAG: 6-carboxytetrahydropterin synthase [Bdellovibrionaceae bacterium]|nr:6-carboxytetrahydropterin synthase [Pseudobdellovibrionaceae bacterium]